MPVLSNMLFSNTADANRRTTLKSHLQHLQKICWLIVWKEAGVDPDFKQEFRHKHAEVKRWLTQ